MSDDNYQFKASTENVIGNNNNQIVRDSQPNHQPIDIGNNSPSVTIHKQAQ